MKISSKKIIIVFLVVVSVILCKNYYDKYVSGVYDVYSFDNYNNNPDEIIRIEIGSSNIFEIAGGMGFLISCYNKKDIMVLGIEIISSNGNEATCMINAKSCIVVNARYINSLMEFYENIK